MAELPGQERFEEQQDESAVEQRAMQLAAAAHRRGAPGQFPPVGQVGRSSSRGAARASAALVELGRVALGRVGVGREGGLERQRRADLTWYVPGELGLLEVELADAAGGFSLVATACPLGVTTVADAEAAGGRKRLVVGLADPDVPLGEPARPPPGGSSAA